MRTFKQFIDLKENVPDHIGSLEDELGINPDDFEKLPQMGAGFGLGGINFNASGYKILKYNKDAQGKTVSADVQLINDPAVNKTRKQVRGGERIPDKADNKVYTMSIKSLNDLIANGLSAPPGGDMGGAPPGDMGGMPPGGMQ